MRTFIWDSKNLESLPAVTKRDTLLDVKWQSSVRGILHEGNNEIHPWLNPWTETQVTCFFFAQALFTAESEWVMELDNYTPHGYCAHNCSAAQFHDLIIAIQIVDGCVRQIKITTHLSVSSDANFGQARKKTQGYIIWARIKSKSQGTHPNWCLFYALRRRNLWGAICRGLQPIISRGAASSFCARLLDNHTRCRTLINCELQARLVGPCESRVWAERRDAERISGAEWTHQFVVA